MLDNIESSLNKKGLTFSDLNNYDKSEVVILNALTLLFLTRFGKDVKLPIFQSNCLCGHEIRQQCYVCPKNSTNIYDIITFGNRCIGKCGYAPAIRGIGVKVKCEYCGSTVNKSGLKRHQKTQTCRNNRNTASNVSTSVGSDE